MVDEVTAIRLAHQSAVEDAAVRVASRARVSSTWLDAANPFLVDPVDAIRSVHVTKSEQLAEYLAASAPQHCLDGWDYLSAAVSSHVRGDPYGATHLAYYAELRAALALLACNSIAVLNHDHAIIDRSGAIHRVTGRAGTHTFAWTALQHWASLPGGADSIGSSIRLSGYSLAQWVTAVGFGPSTPAIALRWCENWGMDLALLAKDRARRNEASYQPSALTQGHELSQTRSAELFSELWPLLAPGEGGDFSQLDMFLVRRAIDLAYVGVKNVANHSSTPEFEATVRRGVADLGIVDDEAERIVAFLTRAQLPNDPWLLRAASQQPVSTTNPFGYESVICRATLLLRLSSGAVKSLLRTSGSTRSELSFWWNPIGLNHGLWNYDAVPSSAADTWTDVEDAMLELTENLENTAPSTMSRRDWQGANAATLLTLSGFERAGLWGIGV